MTTLISIVPSVAKCTGCSLSHVWFSPWYANGRVLALRRGQGHHILLVDMFFVAVV